MVCRTREIDEGIGLVYFVVSDLRVFPLDEVGRRCSRSEQPRPAERDARSRVGRWDTPLTPTYIDPTLGAQTSKKVAQWKKDLRVLATVLGEKHLATAPYLGAGGAIVGATCGRQAGEALRYQVATIALAKRRVGECTVEGEEALPSGLASTQPGECAPEAHWVDLALLQRGPAAYAKCLLEQAKCSDEQIDFVALIAATLQRRFEKWRASLQDNGAGEHTTPKLPSDVLGDTCSILLLGGGGCGKSYVLMKVVRPLIEAFFGPRGFLAQCQSNAGARLINGRTIHSTLGLRPSNSLQCAALRLEGDAKLRLEKLAVPLGCLAIDEVSQVPGKLLNADLLRFTYARFPCQSIAMTSPSYHEPECDPGHLRSGRGCKKAKGEWKGLIGGERGDIRNSCASDIGRSLPRFIRFHVSSGVPLMPAVMYSSPLDGGVHCNLLSRRTGLKLQADCYLQPDQLFGAMPVSLLLGDFLQLPPVPPSDSLLNLESSTFEHRQGVAALSRVRYIFELKTMKRFTDPDLSQTLLLMRTPGGAKIPDHIWTRIVATKLQAGDARLRATSSWVFAAYAWTMVNFMQHQRARETASEAGAVLYYIPAIDQPQHPMTKTEYREMQLEPNMTTTQKLQGVAAFHVGQRVKLTTALLPPALVPEATGTVLGIELHSSESPARGRSSVAVKGCAILQFMPRGVYVRIDDCREQFLPNESLGLDKDALAGVVMVKPISVTWQFACDRRPSGTTRTFTTTVRRTQIPLSPAKISTLHGLQGLTADPGIITDWRLPARLSKSQRWLAHYVMLSRARSLDCILSLGLPDREILEGGPPEHLTANLEKLFGEKLRSTEAAVKEARQYVGW